MTSIAMILMETTIGKFVCYITSMCGAGGFDHLPLHIFLEKSLFLAYNVEGK